VSSEGKSVTRPLTFYFKEEMWAPYTTQADWAGGLVYRLALFGPFELTRVSLFLTRPNRLWAARRRNAVLLQISLIA